MTKWTSSALVGAVFGLLALQPAHADQSPPSGAAGAPGATTASPAPPSGATQDPSQSVVTGSGHADTAPKDPEGGTDISKPLGSSPPVRASSD